MDKQDQTGTPGNANDAPAPARSGAATPEAATALPNVPASWPGAFGLYKYSKAAVKLNFVTLVVVWLLSAVLGGALSNVLKNTGDLFSFIISSLATAAFTLTYLAGVRRQQLSTGQALSKAVNFWLKMIGLNLLVAASIFASIICLVIPFFFVAPRLVLASYFLVDKDMGVIESYKASWAATEGYALRVWGIFGATFLMVLLMITIIGIPFSIYFLIMYSGVYGVVYEYLLKQR